jgi:hypothetical protein
LYGQDLPLLIVINANKGAWNQYIGVFDQERVNKYLGNLKVGAQSVQKLRDGIDIVSSIVAEAKGKDEL